MRAIRAPSIRCQFVCSLAHLHNKIAKERANENGLKSFSQEVVESGGFYFRFWPSRCQSAEVKHSRGLALMERAFHTATYRSFNNGWAIKGHSSLF